ncbi:angiopoietin-related protein 1-like [Gigantopelta aegis]|uniref:angiopoietin-related protein 1-like n=1 Tax=Gigantopelta aegis TaxID=1735272 RepID=UPI001B88D39A|nr:angiopoietin-related protein 1-like [Gigantopelta aegis]
MFVLYLLAAVCAVTQYVDAQRSVYADHKWGLKDWERQHEKYLKSQPPVKILNKGDKILYKDCFHLKNSGYNISGIYKININQSFAFKAHCEFTPTNAYTAIQQRVTSTFNFDTYYSYYVSGFGHPAADYWAGLTVMNHLSVQGNTVLKVRMTDWSGYNGIANYKMFYVHAAAQNFVLNIGGFKTTSTVGDALSYNNGMPFASQDRPDPNNCASRHRTGWWYNYCTRSLPNGHYYMNGPYTPPYGYPDGIFWDNWRGVNYSLRYFIMQVSHF